MSLLMYAGVSLLGYGEGGEDGSYGEEQTHTAQHSRDDVDLVLLCDSVLREVKEEEERD